MQGLSQIKMKRERQKWLRNIIHANRDSTQLTYIYCLSENQIGSDDDDEDIIYGHGAHQSMAKPTPHR